LRATDWKVIYGLNMGQSNPTAAATEAAYAAGALGDRLLGFEIGNEPDLYKQNGYRPSTYSYADFRNEWESFAAAIRAKVPGTVLTGAAASYAYTVYSEPFAHDEASRISLLTQHWYLANGKDPTSTIDKLLQPDAKLPMELAQLVAAASANGIASGLRLAECNSYYNGGSPGVSNSYASALWVIDFLFTVAANGASGVNLHGGGNGAGYTPIADSMGKVVSARPEYYGLTLFALAADGTLQTATASPGAAALSTWAVDAKDGSTAVVLVNRDRAQAVAATIDYKKPITTATATALTGPALEATSGVLLDGAPIAADGSWSPAPQPTVAVAGGRATILVAPASATLVRGR
jgi:hypothetical protein